MHSNIMTCNPYVIITVLDEEVPVMKGSDRKILGGNARPNQQYWYHSTWTGISNPHLNSKHQSYTAMESSFTFAASQCNSSFVFGGVSGRQVIVFSLLHDCETATNAYGKSHSGAEGGGGHTSNTGGSVLSTPPILLGQAVIYLSHRNAWCEGFHGVLPVQDTDEVQCSPNNI